MLTVAMTPASGVAKERTSTRWLIGVVLVLLTAAGCAAGKKAGPALPYWPPDPEITRVRFVRSLASEKDLNTESGLAEGLETFLTGRKPPVSHLHNPLSIAVSDDGQRVYVADFSQTMVYRFDLANDKVYLFNEPGNGEHLFDRPAGVALDGKENIYVTDSTGRQVVVIDPGGKVIDRFGSNELERPTGITIDRTRGLVYVVNGSHQSSTQHTVEVFDTAGKHVRTVGTGKGEVEGAFRFPTYAAVDPAGNLYVTDSLNGRVQVFDPAGKFVRSIGQKGDEPGSFGRPKGVALDQFGNVYVVDSDWSNVQIFNTKGQLLLFFGGRGQYPGMLNNPSGIAIDKNNRIYVADTQNFRVNAYQLVNTTAADNHADGGDVSVANGGGL